MRKVRFLTTLLPALLLPAAGIAGPTDYICKIVDARMVQPDGSSRTDDHYLQSAQKESMGIDRISGRVIHSLFGNALGETEILAQGSEHESFKLMSRFEMSDGFLVVNYYEVDEFDEGRDKKFRLMAGQWLASGTCR